jgi:galactitol-specific phosphotransferase system IIB component
MIVVCGTARGGSTLLWQICDQICKDYDWESLTDQNTLFSKVRGLAGTNTILKTYFMYNQQDSDIETKSGDIIFVAKRDPRDCATSSIKKKFNFPDQDRTVGYITHLAKQAVDQYEFFAHKPDVHIIKYEDYLDNRIKLIEHIAQIIELPCDENKIQEIYEYTSLENQIYRANHAMGSMDLISMITAQHITDGGSGAWKEFLRPEEVSSIHDAIGDWLISNGYEIEV